MKAILFATLALAFATTLFAHKDRLGKISSATLTFEDGGTVIFTKDRVAVLSLALITPAGEAQVTKEDLAGIEYPQFDTIEMTWSTFSAGSRAGASYKVLRFRFGSEKLKAFGEYPEVEFVFYDGKYHHRGFKRKTSPDAWQLEDPELGGVESILKTPNRKP